MAITSILERKTEVEIRARIGFKRHIHYKENWQIEVTMVRTCPANEYVYTTVHSSQWTGNPKGETRGDVRGKGGRMNWWGT